MSRLSQKTDPKAAKILAKALFCFEKLENIDMSAEDAYDARQAENLIRRIVQSNEKTYKSKKQHYGNH